MPAIDAAVRSMRQRLDTIESDRTLRSVTRFGARVGTLEAITFDVIQQIMDMAPESGRPDMLWALLNRAEQLREQLVALDGALFQAFRTHIRSGHYTPQGLRRHIHFVVGDTADQRGYDDVGYDCLDAFVEGLLLDAPAPEETQQREREMVYYQPTPARIILQLIDRAHITENDVFYDLGSGLGQVVTLVHLLTGAKATGVEFQAGYCDYARASADALNLSGVRFINTDARNADYSDGTVFFMYTPFEGQLLGEVLNRLRYEARRRTIRVATYGPCTLKVWRQDWLHHVDQTEPHMHRLAVFRSLPPHAS